MITFYFENGCVCTIRTSGTEPKIKWYSEIRDVSGEKWHLKLKKWYISNKLKIII